MMKKLTFVLFSLLIIFTSCSKNKDEITRPRVQIINPPAFSVFSAGETILVEASVYHEKTVRSVQAALVNDDNIPVCAPVGATPNQNVFQIDFELEIDNPGIISGNYFIMVKASDEESTTRTFQPVEIKGIPVELRRLLVITRLNTLKSNIYFIDSAYNINHILGINKEFAGSAVSSEYQQLYYISPEPSRLLTYNLEDTLLAWDYNALLPYPILEDVSFAENLVYVASQNGDIKGLNSAGQIIYGTPTHSDRVPEKIFRHHNFIIADQRTRSDMYRYFVVFYSATGAFANQFRSDLEVVSFFSRSENEIIAFGNENDQAKIIVYGIEENNGLEPAAMPTGKLLYGIQINENEVLLAMDYGVIKYNIQTFQYNQVFEHDEVISMDYDTLNQFLSIARNNKIFFYNYPGASLLHTVTMDEPVLNIHFLYNK